MSIDTLEAEIEDVAVPAGSVESDAPADSPAIESEAGASPVGETSAGVVESIAESPEIDPGASQAASRTPKQQIEDAERDEQIEEATAEVCQIQEDLDKAKADADKANHAKKAATALVDDLSLNLLAASRRLGRLRKGRFPDPENMPLLDTDRRADARAEINATFAKPEAIAPLPPDTQEEFYRRKRRDTKLADIGLKPKVVEILAEAGLRTIFDLDKIFEGGADLTTIKVAAGTITEKRREEILDAIGNRREEWDAEWAAAHPAPLAEDQSHDDGDEDGEIDSMLDANDEEDELDGGIGDEFDGDGE
jgi:hypothetical protein